MIKRSSEDTLGPTDLLQVRDGLGPQLSSQVGPAQRVQLVPVEVYPE